MAKNTVDPRKCYGVIAECRNCGLTLALVRRKGETVSQCEGYPCPVCGCKTVRVADTAAERHPTTDC